MLETFHETISTLDQRLLTELDEALALAHRTRMVVGLSGQGDDNVPVGQQKLHQHAQFGLSLSGGGIRSASFCMGVLQQMAEKGVLSSFHFISAVSGGGYAASWLVAWALRHRRGIDGVQEELNSSRASGVGPIRWVRRYGSYLAPTFGFTSADTWALIAAYLRNWAPILLFLALVIAATMVAPLFLVAFATWLRDVFKEHAGWTMFLFWFATALVLLMLATYLRTLTLFQTDRHEVAPKKVSQEGRVMVLTLVAGYLVVIATPFLPKLLDGLALLTFVSGNLDESTRLWVGSVFCWVAIYLMALVFALVLSWIKSLARMLGTSLLPGNVVQRSTRHLIGALVGSACSGALGGGLLILVLQVHAVSWQWEIAMGPLLLVLLFGLSETPVIVLTDGFQRDVDRAWAARVGGWMLAASVTWFCVFGISILGRMLWEEFGYSLLIPLAFLFAAALYSLLAVGRWQFAKEVATTTMALTVLIILSGLVSFLIAHADLSDAWHLLPVFVISAVSAYLFGAFIDFNRFSLHAIYREGLIRTFLGASRLSPNNVDVGPVSEEERSKFPKQFDARRPERLTNIDDDDNPALAWLEPTRQRKLPLLLLNAAVNGRSATDVQGRVPRQWPFAFGPVFSGSPVIEIGFAKTESVFSLSKSSPAGISLGAAMAVSGAAVSPTSGNSTHPMRALMIGLINARLGLWVGNPKDPDAVVRGAPRRGGLTILKELLGFRSLFGRWIHLSDGGHFENLGIYELLRRGCRRIVVVDASCDPKRHFRDFADAIRRVQVDLGVKILRKDDWMIHRPDAQPDRDQQRSWMWFDVDYGVDAEGNRLPLGRLLYIKPSIYEQQSIPPEVRHYYSAERSFPHESTRDQFFSEKQLEAYRALGSACADEALSAALSRSPTGGRDAEVDRALRASLMRGWRANPQEGVASD